jgi:hypothetical protein
MHPAREDAARELLEKLRAVTKRLRRPPLNCPSPASDVADPRVDIAAPDCPIGGRGGPGILPCDDRRPLDSR